MNMMEEKKKYVGWEEVYVSKEKGKREIHYVLKRKDGGSDLGVIAKEKTFGHITYRFLIDFNSSSSSFKPKSRRDLVFWLNSFAPGTDSVIPVLPQMSHGSADGNDMDVLDIETMKASQLRKLGHYTKEFTWLGSQWMCKKKRKHYQAFRRNGIKISVNQFVHVLAEENKRLVAYLDDMYEDVKGNKMVVVRWFHKIDEIGIDLPHNFDDREIFFSLCLQDLSVECIDGLATVLSSEHYKKFVSEAEHVLLQPYVCCQQYDNEDVKPLEITRVKGYWKQDVVKYMLSNASRRVLTNTELPGDSWKNEDANDVCENKPRKRLRLSRERKVDVQCASVRGGMETCQTNVAFAQGSGSLSKKDCTDTLPHHIRVGSSVEVLSQDSGMRGCWFRTTIIKKHKNKVKIRYLDIKDAEKEADYLEEWVLASRIAASDDMSLRLDGRTVIRPSVLRPGKVSWAFNVGTIVDAWWHDGWWEGIVIRKESKDQFQVYFPGEKRQASFIQSDLRHSQEWLGGSWKELSERVDIAVSILSAIVKKREGGHKPLQAHVSNENHRKGDLGKGDSFGTRDCSSYLHRNTAHVKANSSAFIDLSKDDFLSQLKWKSSHKRKRSGFVVRKLQQHRSYGINFDSTESRENDREFIIPSALKAGEEPRKSVKADRDNCKYITDSLFTPSVVPSLSNLVMSR